MNINQLQLFQTVALCENISDAAELLHLTQPAVSRSIRLMEKELGFSLFNHYRNRICLNSNGQEFLSMTHSILDQYNSTVLSIQKATERKINNISITFSSGGLHLPDLMHEFKKLHPAVSFTLKTYYSSQLEPALCDFLLFSSSIPDTDRECRVLFKEQLFITLNIQHPLAKKTQICLSDLKNENFLLSGSTDDMYHIQMYYCGKIGFHPSSCITVDKQHLLLSLISLNEGIALLPKLTSHSDYITQIPIQDIACYRYVQLLRLKKENDISQIGLQFEAFCMEYFKTVLYEKENGPNQNQI